MPTKVPQKSWRAEGHRKVQSTVLTWSINSDSPHVEFLTQQNTAVFHPIVYPRLESFNSTDTFSLSSSEICDEKLTSCLFYKLVYFVITNLLFWANKRCEHFPSKMKASLSSFLLFTFSLSVFLRICSLRWGLAMVRGFSLPHTWECRCVPPCPTAS